MTEPVVIEVAINGITKKVTNPNVPITAQEIAAESIALLDAGATIIHNHIEDISLPGAAAAEEYRAGWAPILECHPDAILIPSVVLAKAPQDKGSHFGMTAQYGAKMGALDTGSLNLADTAEDGTAGPTRVVYTNSFDEIEICADALFDAGLAASIAVYEPGFLRAALAYHRAGRLRPGSIAKLYFSGDYDVLGKARRPANLPAIGFGLPPTRKALDAYLEMLEGSGMAWSVAVMGADIAKTDVLKAALERGGHVRVGIEDYSGPDTPTNLELLQSVVAECHAVGRPLADCASARRIVGLQ